jgi:putative CocE/NonD family hydrolase
MAGDNAITVEFDVPVPLRDGTVLRANVFRPAGSGPYPILLTRTPYGKDLRGAYSQIDPVQAARLGYAVVVQDVRGTGWSGGEWHPFVHEGNDGSDTIAWAASLPYADGQVGTFGNSYLGFTQWSAAAQTPPALKVIAPANTWIDALDGAGFRGGALELGLVAGWGLLIALPIILRRYGGDPIQLGAALRHWVTELDAMGTTGYQTLPLDSLRPLADLDLPFSLDELLRGGMDRSSEEIEHRTVRSRLGGVSVPSLHIAGWYDIFLGGTLAGYRAMRDRGLPVRLIIGPWTHVKRDNPIGERNFGAAAEAGFMDLRADLQSVQIQWFDHWMRGRDLPSTLRSPVRLFVMGANRWRDEDDWPLPRAVETPWYLRHGSALSDETPGYEEPDRLIADPQDPVPTLGGATLITPEYPAGPYDQRPIESRPDVQIYRSTPLARDLEVTGPIRATLWAITSTPDVDLVARLVDIFPDGRSVNLTDGIVRASYRDAQRGGSSFPLEPGRPFCVEIDLWATSNLFLAGHRIGLHVTTSNFPRWDRNLHTAEPLGTGGTGVVAHIEILHDMEHPSCITLPIVPPE